MFTFLFLICSEAWQGVLLLQAYWELLKEVLMISITIYSGWFKYVILKKGKIAEWQIKGKSHHEATAWLGF